MIWIIAFLCLGLVGLVGYYQGPIRAASSFVGLIFAILLSSTLAPLFAKILPVVGVQHPAWLKIMAPVLAFLLILIIFKIIGHTLHRKVSVFYKYKVEERVYFRWERMYKRVGLCVGLLNGAVYFFVLLLPFYVAGYLTTQIASGEEDPAGVRFISSLREQIHASNLDRVMAAYDPAPADYYRAADIIALLKENRLLEGRLSHYPVFLTLKERPEFQELAKDVQFQEMFQKPQTRMVDVLNYPKVHSMLTNAQTTAEISGVIGDNLADLHEFLKTGKSAKFESERILGYWSVNQAASLTQARRKLQNPTPKRWNEIKLALIPAIADRTLTFTTDNKAILKLEKANSDPKVLSQGTWSKQNDQYTVNLPGSKPPSSDVSLEADDQIMITHDGINLVFSKED